MDHVHLDPLVSTIPFNVTTDSVEVWVGSLARGNPPPSHTAIRFRKEGSSGKYQHVPVTADGADWDWVFPGKGWHRVVRLTGLKPDTAYDIQFGRKRGTTYDYGGQCVAETLPKKLLGGPGRAFTVALGSCFYDDEDDGQVSRAFKRVYGDAAHRPHIKFLVGDQVYADIGIPLHTLNTTECRDRLMAGYEGSWKALSSMLRRGANFIIPDDHEFFNDFPFEPPLMMVNLAALRNDDYRKRWTDAARRAVRTITQTSSVRTFSIGSEISFCVADFRTLRSPTRLLPESDLQRIEAWARGLRCPGVLVTSQLVMRGKGSGADHNLADFTSQYQRLVQAIAGVGHDVVVLTGDVHFGRISEVPIHANGSSLIEVVSSPLSNLTGIYGVSQAGPDTTPKEFPSVSVPGVTRRRVNHRVRASAVGGAGNSNKRTNEHFTTVSFRKGPNGIGMTVIGWRVRTQAGALPKKDYTWMRTIA